MTLLTQMQYLLTHRADNSVVQRVLVNCSVTDNMFVRAVHHALSAACNADQSLIINMHHMYCIQNVRHFIIRSDLLDIDMNDRNQINKTMTCYEEKVSSACQCNWVQLCILGGW